MGTRSRTVLVAIAPLLRHPLPLETCLASSLLTFRKHIKNELFRWALATISFVHGVFMLYDSYCNAYRFYKIVCYCCNPPWDPSLGEERMDINLINQ